MARKIVQTSSILVIFAVGGCGSDTEQQAENRVPGDTVKEQISEVGSSLGEKTDSIKGSLSDGLTKSKNAVGNLVDATSEHVDTAKDSLTDGLAKSKNAMLNLGDSASETMGSAKDSIADGVNTTKDTFSKIGTGVENGMERMGSATSNVAGGIKDSFASGVDKTEQTTSNLAQSARSKLDDFGNATADKARNAGNSISDSTHAMTEQAKAGVGSIAGSTKGLAAKAMDSTESAAFTPNDQQLEKITFDHDSSELDQRSESILDGFAERLKRQSSLKLEIIGYTDSLGSEDYNIWLSEQRALLVQGHLVARGVNPNNLIIKGLGEQNPISQNRTEAGRRTNRRVELIIIE